MHLLLSILHTGIFLFLMNGSVPPATASPASSMLLRLERSVELLEDGRAHLLSFRMPDAERYFRRLATQPDGAPAAYYHLAQSALFQGMMTDEERYYERFYSRSDTLMKVLGAAPKSPWRDYLEAEAHLQRAMAAAKTGHYLRAAWAARSAYVDFDRLVRAHPDFYDAYKGLGLLHVCIGSLPGAYRSLLGILGFGGTVTGGLRELDLAARHSRYNREEATIYRALTETILYGATAESTARIRPLYEQYPASPGLAHLYGFLLLADRQAVAAEHVLQRAARRADDPAYFYVNYVDFYLADALFKLDRFGEAEHYFRRYLERHRGPALKAVAYLSLGEALEMQGRREEAVDAYREVESARDFDTEAAALRAAREHLAAPMTASERRLLLGRTGYDGGRYDRAREILEAMVDDPGTPHADRVEAAYRLGRVHHAEGQFQQAMQAYRYAVDHAVDPEARWAPWAQYYIGEIHLERGERAEARQAFERAAAYRGRFDYAQALEQSVRAALERLDAGG